MTESTTRYIKRLDSKHVLIWSPLLAKQDDMVECTKDGTVIAQPKRKAAKGLAEAAEPAVLPPRAPRDEKIRLAKDDAPEEPPEVVDMKKAELIKFAKDRFDVDLDPADSKAVLQKRVDALMARAKGDKSAPAE